jgi:DNA-binding NtrC family response regulator
MEDLAAIAGALLTRLCEKYDRSRPALKPQELQTLHSYPFPGNVRELRNLLERSLLRTEPHAHELSLDLEWLKGRGIFENAPGAETTPGPASRANRLLSALEQQEYDLIARTLASENGGIRRAAAKLGLTHQALLRRLQKWPELRPTTAPIE